MSDFKVVSVLNPSVVILSGVTGPAISAGTQSQSTGTVAFSNSNGVSFGLSNGVMTASFSGGGGGGANFSAGVSTAGNTAGNTGTVSNQVVFQGGNNVTLSQQTDAAGATVIISGANTVAQTSLNFSNSNNVSFGVAGSTLTASASFPAQTAFVFSNSNGVSFGTNGSTVTATVKTDYLTTQTVQTQASGAIAGSGFTTTTTNGSVVVGTHDSAGLKLAVPAFLTTNQAQTNYVFSNSNNVSFGTNGSTVTATATFAQTADTNKAGTGYTSTTQAGTTVGVTQNTSGLSIAWPPFITTYAAQSTQTQAAGNIAGVGTSLNLTNLTGTLAVNSNGVALSLSAPTPGGGGAINVSAGTTSGNLQTIQFADSNGVSWGLNGSTITASAAGGAGGMNISVSNTSSQLTQLVFPNSNGVTWGLTNNSITANIPMLVSANNGSGAMGTLSFQDGNGISWGTNANGVQATVSAQTNQTVASGNIAGVGTTFGGTNISGSMTLDSSGLVLSLSAPSGTTDSIYSVGFVGPQATTSVGQSSLYMNYVQMDDPLSVCRVENMVSMNIGATTSFTTSVAAGTSGSVSTVAANNWQMTRSFGVYTRGTGASSTQLQSASSNSVSIGGTRGYSYSYSISSNSVTHGATNGFTIAGVRNIDTAGGVTYTTLAYSTTASNTASSAANITTTTGTTSIANVSTSNHTGVIAVPIPWGSSLPANNIWFGFIQASSSTSSGTNSTVMSVSNFVATNNSATAYRHITQTQTSAGFAQIPGQGVYSAATGAFPATIGFTQINNNTVFSNGFFPTVLMNITL